MNSARIVYAGTPEFAVAPLQAMLAAGQRPVAVFTQPDRPAGRGRKLQASPVKLAAEQADLPVYQPAELRSRESVATLQDLKPDLIVVVAYGLILPQAVLDLPAAGCWNIHASLLPRWRGAAPIQRAIEAGDDRSGICIMQMEAGLDTGPVIRQQSLAIGSNETAGSLHDRLAALGASLLRDCLQQWQVGQRLPATDQSADGIRYAHKLEKAEARLDWTRPAIQLDRQVRAFNPWPVAWCELGGQRLRIWASRIEETSDPAEAGSIRVYDGRLFVAAGDGLLELLEVQPAGKRRMPAADFVRTRTLPLTMDFN